MYVTSNDFSPVVSIKAVTPNDSADLPDGPCRAMLLTGSGNLKITTAAGDVVTLPISTNWFGVTYIRAARVWATGTTVSSSNIFACY
jgi:hypothetical protein